MADLETELEKMAEFLKETFVEDHIIRAEMFHTLGGIIAKCIKTAVQTAEQRTLERINKQMPNFYLFTTDKDNANG